MVVFAVKKVYPFPKETLKEYFMCFKVWGLGMPYKEVQIEPKEKNIWDWKIRDNIDFIVLKWNFEHKFTSIQVEHENHLSVNFKNSNHIKKFDGSIDFKEKQDPETKKFKCLVEFKIRKLKLKDPLLNRLRDPFIGIMKADYKRFLNNVYEIIMDKEIRKKVLEECWWVEKSRIDYQGS
ncbi:MAG: hypothetical protein GF329_17065 [Candidatus Lokiarchaeota archaeon]|nr:hypothetical protein [Candidatus Lokiarchaeota archaeon]